MLTVKNLDVSKVVYQATWTESLDHTCSSLSFLLPTAQAVEFSCGDTVVFTYRGTKVFYGYLFEVDKGQWEARCTAYDQLRYLQVGTPLMRENETLTSFAQRVLTYAGDRIRVGTLADTRALLVPRLFESSSYMNMLKKSIEETRELSGVRYILRDEFGAVALRNPLELRTDLIVGDGSLATDYRHALLVNDTACNYVKVAKDNSADGLRDAVVVQDPALIAKWGKLSAFKTLSSGNAAQMKALAQSMLTERGREQERISVDCIGDLRLRAGCEVTFVAAQVRLNLRALITSAVHSFAGNEYTAKLTLERSVW